MKKTKKPGEVPGLMIVRGLWSVLLAEMATRLGLFPSAVVILRLFALSVKLGGGQSAVKNNLPIIFRRSGAAAETWGATAYRRTRSVAAGSAAGNARGLIAVDNLVPGERSEGLRSVEADA
jgi:hypothetical protein